MVFFSEISGFFASGTAFLNPKEGMLIVNGIAQDHFPARLCSCGGFSHDNIDLSLLASKNNWRQLEPPKKNAKNLKKHRTTLSG